MPPGENNITPPQKKRIAIRTFAGDVAETVQNGGGSLTKMALAESERSRRIGINALTPPLEPKKRHFLLLFSLLAITGGLGILGFVLLTRTTQEETPVVIKATFPKLLLADKERELKTDSLIAGTLTQSLMKIKTGETFTLGDIVTFTFTKNNATTPQYLTTNEIFSLSEWKAPNDLTRSLEPYYAFGFHSFKKNEPFVILKTHSYQNAYAGMLAWENRMKSDFQPLFISRDVEEATTTDILLRTKKWVFEDTVIKNRDARVLKDADTPLLFYSFLDKETILITTNEETFKAVIEKMLSGKIR
jgi:hypothetical protein